MERMVELNWEAEPPHSCASAFVGKVTPMPGLEYIVEIWGKNASGLGGEEHYLIRIEAFGCDCAKSFPTKEGTMDYLLRQVAKLREFVDVKARRDDVGERIKPLHEEWDKLGEEVFKLLEVR